MGRGAASRFVPAVVRGAYAVSPALMRSWMPSPVLSQGIGLLWLSEAIRVAAGAPAGAFDLPSEAEAFYSLFYGMTAGSHDMAALTGTRGEAA